MKTLKVKIDRHYGTESIYPDCDKSRLLVQLTGQKTMTKKTIRLLKELGYKLEIQAKEL